MITDENTLFSFKKIDLSLFPSLRLPNVCTELQIGNKPRSVTGHSKAAQNFLRALMTPLGHFKATPEYGSEFSNLIHSGQKIYPEDLPNIFATESLRVVEHLFVNKNPDTPDDEIIIRAVLDNYVVHRTTIDLTIFLYYRNEGSPKEITLPFNLGSL